MLNQATNLARPPLKERMTRLRTCCSVIFLTMLFPCLAAGLTVFNYLQARRSFLEAKKQEAVNDVLAQAYPHATMIETHGSLTTWDPFDWDLLTVKIVFETSDSFDGVRTWYIQHPKGGNCGLREEGFPTCGLTDLTVRGAKTRYQVDYTIYVQCEGLKGPIGIDCLGDHNVVIQ